MPVARIQLRPRPDTASRADVGETQSGVVKINKRPMRRGETMAGDDPGTIHIVNDIAPYRFTPGVFRFLNHPDLSTDISKLRRCLAGWPRHYDKHCCHS